MTDTGIDDVKTDLVMRALAGAVDERPEWRDPAMEALYAYQEPSLLYGACLAWATAVRTVTGDGTAFTGLVAFNVDTGGFGSLDDVPIPGYAKTGMRFILAVQNGDTESAWALFRASLESGPEDANGIIAAVLFLTGWILRNHAAANGRAPK